MGLRTYSQAPKADRQGDYEVEPAAESGKDEARHSDAVLAGSVPVMVWVAPKSLFFDADWFDAKLAEHELDRAALAIAAGLERGDLHAIFTNETQATAEELNVFARVLRTDLFEIRLRSGIAQPRESEDASGRIESIEARLNAIDDWLAEFEKARKRA